MRRLRWIACAALMVACSETPDQGSRTGSGGTGGVDPVIPAAVDQLCRDFCANENGGEDCGPQNCVRMAGAGDACSDVQACYERCLGAYEYRANWGAPCPEEYECFSEAPFCTGEWIADLTCLLDLECNDLFGDCDSVTEQILECEGDYSELRNQLVTQWCSDTCPSDPLCSSQSKCFIGSGGSGGVGGAGGIGGTGGIGGAAGSGDPPFLADCSNGALAAPLSNCQPEPLPSTGDPYADCVTRINQLRWECQCLPALQRWNAAQGCADQHAEYDSTRSAHAGFRDDICSPRGWAQNECPGWPSEDRVITGCLQAMWDEGPGEPFSAHGHYLNMTNPSYTMVACGFYETPDGQVWSVQNFQ